MDNKLTLEKTLVATPLLQVLDFLLQHPDTELNDTEIAASVKTARKSAVNLALRRLAAQGLVNRYPRGRMMFNSLIESPLVIQFKITSNLIHIQPLLQKIIPVCSRIILFGSRADGTNNSESDFDLLVVAVDEDAVRKTVRKNPLAEKIQMLVKSHEQMLTFEKDEPGLSAQVRKGIVLWQRK